MGMDPIDVWNHMSAPSQLAVIMMGLMSVYMVYVVIDKFIQFYSGSKQTYSYVIALRDYLGQKRIEDAVKAARVHRASPVAKVMSSGLLAYQKGREALENDGPQDVGEFDLVDSVNRALERVKERETSDLRKRLGGLATIASIAPFVGLFGTVFGIIGAFRLLKGGGTIDDVAPAIAEALYATAFGIALAIPAAMFFNYFTGRVEHVVVDMNDVSSEFIDFVLKEGRES